MKHLLILFSTYLILIGCNKAPEAHNYTYYYWRTKLALDATEKNSLAKTTTPILYTRYFDIDKKDGKFFPVGTITKDSTFVTDRSITPVIYITNRSMMGITNDELKFLAKSITDLISKKNAEFGLKTNQEIQIDCDWTKGTRDDYFKFLKVLKEVSKKNITSTLRLHQARDTKQMGIPPVDKVYLMCYSTSSPLDTSDRNSILDVQILKNYLSNLDDYPIKNIDIALPIYSWGIVTNHMGQHKLINGLSAKDLNNADFKKLSDYEIEVTKDGFYFGYLLNKGFKLKIEEISKEQLKETTDFLDSKIKRYNIVYYHLDSRFTENYTL